MERIQSVGCPDSKPPLVGQPLPHTSDILLASDFRKPMKPKETPVASHAKYVSLKMRRLKVQWFRSRMNHFQQSLGDAECARTSKLDQYLWMIWDTTTHYSQYIWQVYHYQFRGWKGFDPLISEQSDELTDSPPVMLSEVLARHPASRDTVERNLPSTDDVYPGIWSIPIPGISEFHTFRVPECFQQQYQTVNFWFESFLGCGAPCGWSGPPKDCTCEEISPATAVSDNLRSKSELMQGSCASWGWLHVVNQKSGKIWYVLIMPALFQDRDTRSQWVERLKRISGKPLKRMNLLVQIGNGQVTFDPLILSLQVWKPRRPIHFDVRQKAPNGDSSETRQHCHPKPAELFVIKSQAKGKSTNQLVTSTILIHRLFHQTTSCFKNPSGEPANVQKKQKKWHWERERSSSWKVPTNSCHLANCNCCAHLSSSSMLNSDPHESPHLDAR